MCESEKKMKKMIKANLLWIFVVVFTMSINSNATCTGSCDGGKSDCCKPPSNQPNLAVVKWAHAVNNEALLKSTLQNDGIKMIEADVVMGTKLEQPTTQSPEITTITAHVSQKPGKNENLAPKDTTEMQKDKIPIMSHPPSEISDLSFKDFVDIVSKHNANSKEEKTKGVKLDFKSLEAVQKSLPLIKEAKSDLHPLWINADILVGPGNPTNKEVDAKAFFEAVKAEKNLNKSTLSIGWTTNLVDNIQYNNTHVDEMLKTIRDNIKSDEDKLHPITFPVRAAIAVQSKDVLNKLVTEVEKMDITATLTIWSAQNDNEKLDIKKVQELIDHFGVDKVYVDLDEKLKEKLTLASKPNAASSLVNFGLLNVVTFLFALFIKSGFY